MIQDDQCNRVFFSALLRERCPIAFRGLTEVLDKYDVPWSLLEGTTEHLVQGLYAAAGAAEQICRLQL